MKTATYLLLSLSVLLALGGCARPAKVSLTTSGEALPKAAQYFIPAPEGEESLLPPDIQAKLIQQLAAHGLQASPADQADILITAELSNRTAKIGLYTKSDTVNGVETPHWLKIPDKHGRFITRFSVRFINPHTGDVLREVSVLSDHNRKQGKTIIDRLIASAIVGQDVEAAK